MNKFDKQIKEHLENQELPFDPKAWEKMCTRLDQVMPVNKTGLPWKSILGISALVVTAAAIYFTNKSQSEGTSIEKLNSLNVTELKSSLDNGSETFMNQIESSHIENSKDNSIKVIAPTGSEPTMAVSGTNYNLQPTVKITNTKSIQSTVSGIGQTNYDISTIKQDISDVIINDNSVKYSFDLKSTYCENQALEIENKYSSTFKLVSENDVFYIPVKGSLSIKKLKVGEYVLFNENEKIQSFIVNPVENSNKVAIIEDYHFVKGVPQIVVQPETQNIINSWSINGVKMNSSEYIFNAFNKGDYEIKFQTNGSNGCPMEILTKIQVDQNYNLLAPNAFNINSQDQRNRSFIPYALTQRDTPFEMIIVEPSSGRVIYRTTTTEGWDGIDQTTGEMVLINKTYIWKVTLFKPLQGEKKEYSNIVTRVQ